MFLLSKNSSVSNKLKGSSLILSVTRLWRPPLFLKRLLIIHDAADPHTIRRISFLALAQLFQKCSSPDRKSEPRVSNQGNSSKNIIFFLLPFCFSKRLINWPNASNQFWAGTISFSLGKWLTILAWNWVVFEYLHLQYL